jgi:hypothetical protein
VPRQRPKHTQAHCGERWLLTAEVRGAARLGLCHDAGREQRHDVRLLRRCKRGVWLLHARELKRVCAEALPWPAQAQVQDTWTAQDTNLSGLRSRQGSAAA